MGLLWTSLAVLVVAGGLLYRRRLRRGARGVTDDMMSQIEQSGWVDVEDPLDLEEAREAEQEFWQEEWDEPEQW